MSKFWTFQFFFEGVLPSFEHTHFPDFFSSTTPGILSDLLRASWHILFRRCLRQKVY